MAHGSGPDSPVPRTSGAEASPDTARAEQYLRQLAERELRWADGQTDPPPGPSDGAPVQAPAVRAVDRARNAGGALVAAGTIAEPVVAAILSELVEALVVRSRLPARHTYRNRFRVRIAPASGSHQSGRHSHRPLRPGQRDHGRPLAAAPLILKN